MRRAIQLLAVTAAAAWVLRGLLHPPVSTARERTSIQHMKAIARAVVAYRRDHGGDLPSSLRELAPAYLEAERLRDPRPDQRSPSGIDYSLSPLAGVPSRSEPGQGSFVVYENNPWYDGHRNTVLEDGSVGRFPS
jgi:hypothetical protein